MLGPLEIVKLECKNRVSSSFGCLGFKVTDLARSIVWLNFQAAEGEEKNGTNVTKEEEPCTYETYPCSETVSLNSSQLFFRSNLKGIFNRCEQLSFVHPCWT